MNRCLFPSFTKTLLCLQARTFTCSSSPRPLWTFTNASFQTSFSAISPHLGRYPKVAISLACIMLPPSRIPHSADLRGAWQAQRIFLTSELQLPQPGLCENCSKKVAEIKNRIFLFLTQSDSGCDKTKNSLEFSILNNVYQILPHLGMHQSIERELKDRKGWENKRRCKKQKEEYEIKGRICQSNLCTCLFSCYFEVSFVLSWSKSSFEFFHNVVWKNPNELFSQLNRGHYCYSLFLHYLLILALPCLINHWVSIPLCIFSLTMKSRL